MTKVSYVVRKNGFNGGIKVDTYQKALAKASDIGGYVKAIYTKMPKEPLTEKEIVSRDKRLAYFGLA